MYTNNDCIHEAQDRESWKDLMEACKAVSHSWAKSELDKKDISFRLASYIGVIRQRWPSEKCILSMPKSVIHTIEIMTVT